MRVKFFGLRMNFVLEWTSILFVVFSALLVIGWPWSYFLPKNMELSLFRIPVAFMICSLSGVLILIKENAFGVSEGRFSNLIANTIYVISGVCFTWLIFISFIAI